MIELIKCYPYDNNYDYIKTFSTVAEQDTWFNQFDTIRIFNDDDYTRDNESFIIEYNYDDLVNQGVNYITFNNGYRFIYAFITSKEYVNDSCTRLNFEVDVIQTYMFDFNLKKSFVERKKCSLSEIAEYDEGLEIGEHIIENDTIVLNKRSVYFAMFGGFKDYNVKDGVITEFPYVDTTKPQTNIDGINYPFMMIALDTEIGVTSFYKYLSDMPNLLGIIKMPNCSYSSTTYDLPIVKIVDNVVTKSYVKCPKVVISITGANENGESISIPKSNITDFYPYTYYVLTDGETEPLIMQPQYLNSSVSINSHLALSHTPVERYFPSYYKGDTTGRTYNITNSNVMMLPVGTNGGMETIQANANSIAQQKNSMLSNILVGGAVAIGGALTGGVGYAIAGGVMATTVTGGINSIKENIARNKDLELTPSTIKSYGTPSTREKFNTNNVRVIKYTIQDKYKTRLNNFIDRYGNKYNNYATIDINSYKGFLKMVSPDVDGKIDNIYINKIISILERGVFIE